MCDEAELCDLTVDLLCLSQDLIHAKLRLENSAKVHMDVLETVLSRGKLFTSVADSGCFSRIQDSKSDLSIVDKIPDPHKYF
jgi:hypothetical protein